MQDKKCTRKQRSGTLEAAPSHRDTERHEDNNEKDVWPVESEGRRQDPVLCDRNTESGEQAKKDQAGGRERRRLVMLSLSVRRHKNTQAALKEGSDNVRPQTRKREFKTRMKLRSVTRVRERWQTSPVQLNFGPAGASRWSLATQIGHVVVIEGQIQLIELGSAQQVNGIMRAKKDPVTAGAGRSWPSARR
jgi:hypothetical protein